MSQDQVLAPAVEVEIIAYAPTEFFHCLHCEVVWSGLKLGQDWHAAQRESSLPPELQAEYDAISAWVAEAGERYGQRVRFRIVDATSIQGLLASVRHRSRRFPVFVINGSERFSGFDRQKLDQALARSLQEEVKS
jgi:hypothetical protein